MRVVPDSLFGRLFVAIVAAVAITLLIILALIVRERREFALLESGVGSSVSGMAETIENLAQLTSAQRRVALADMREERRSLAEMRRARFADRRQNREELEQIIVSRLQDKLGDAYRVRALRADRVRRDALSFTDEPLSNTSLQNEDVAAGPRSSIATRRLFQIEVVLPDGDSIAFRIPPPRSGPPLPQRIFLDFGILAVILAVVLYAMTRTITRPIGKLAQAADAAGRGASVAPLPEEGGRELRAATRAFNAMQDRLRRYLDSRTRVLAAMSHDMRTPLTRLRLRVESIEDDQLRARCTADLDEMNNMIRGALAVFRGLNDEEPAVPIDIDALLESLRTEFTELGGVITVTGRVLDPYVGKPLALKRCLANLIHNAIQYGHEANVSVEDGAALIIRVHDRGPGIPAEALEQVFEPFFRLETSRNRGTGGTGLGLSIARDLAQAHGGTLNLRNSQAGLIAELILPRRPA
jgi:signal transduction histidine kinase